MKTEHLIINRSPVWITFDKIKSNHQDARSKALSFVVCYVKLSEPKNEDYGELLKNEQDEILVYANIDKARQRIINVLNTIIYPPDFLHPLEYTVYNVEEIMNKWLHIFIGAIDSEEISYCLKGVICQCSFAGNPSYLPVAVKVRRENKKEKIVHIFEMKKIEKP
jgi:hypothetical protein